MLEYFGQKFYRELIDIAHLQDFVRQEDMNDTAGNNVLWTRTKMPTSRYVEDQSRI